jgi:hypothetical protein
VFELLRYRHHDCAALLCAFNQHYHLRRRGGLQARLRARLRGRRVEAPRLALPLLAERQGPGSARGQARCGRGLRRQAPRTINLRLSRRGDRRQYIRDLKAARHHDYAALLCAFNQHYLCDGAVVFKHACALGCEGVVSKRLGSPYRFWLNAKYRAAPAVKREAEED